MQCPFPVHVGADQYAGCGQCMPCRIHHRRITTGKLLLESLSHPPDRCLFVTLTYDEENMPYTLPDAGEAPLGNLEPDHFRKWLDAARKRHAVRYLWVGEYGEESGRPHYHMMAFGVSGPDMLEEIGRWQYGRINDVQWMNPGRAAYISGYTTKKLTNPDLEVLNGRHPEIVRMSRRPALGDRYLDVLAKWYASHQGQLALREMGDVVGEFRYGGKMFPLGYRHKQLLRMKVGLHPLTSVVKVDMSAEQKARYAPEAITEEVLARRQRELDRHAQKARFFKVPRQARQI